MMVKRIDRETLKEMVKKRVKEVLTPCQIFAGLIWHFCINSKDHFYQTEYYDYPASFQYLNDGVSIIEVSYLQKTNQWTIISPDYKHVERLSPLILSWLDETYFAYLSSQKAMAQVKSRRPRRRSPFANRQRRKAIRPITSSFGEFPILQNQHTQQPSNEPPKNNQDTTH